MKLVLACLWFAGVSLPAVFGLGEVPPLTEDAPPFIEDGVYVFEIGGQELGREEISFSAHGWSSSGWFDVGQGKTTHEASVEKHETGNVSWHIKVLTRGQTVEINGEREGTTANGHVSPGDITASVTLPEDADAFFFENLVWGCFTGLGRALAAKANTGELSLGYEVQGVMAQRGVLLPFKITEYAKSPQAISGEIVPLWMFRMDWAAGMELRLLCAPDGIPLQIEVPAQNLKVCLEDFKDLHNPGADPVTIVDSGPWRDLLSPPDHEVVVEKGVKIPMRGGVHLVADVHRPEGDGKYPTILVRTPYNRTGEAAAKGGLFAPRGYAVVAQDVRGRFDSEGDWFPLVNETADGSDTIDWIAEQPWSDGKVGMIGGSYVAWVQWYAVKSGNPHLKAIVPQVSPPDPDENIPYEGGAFLLSSGWWAKVLDHMAAGGTGLPDVDFLEAMRTLPLGDLDKALGTEHPFLDEWVAHGPADEYWDDVQYQKGFTDYDVAALHISGWFDGDQPGAVQNYPAMRRGAKTETARNSQFLIMGPWTHAFNTFRKMGDVDWGRKAIVDLDSVYVRFFDRYLKGVDNGIDKEDSVLVFVMGENRWRREADWPLPGTEFTKVFLGSKGDARDRVGDGVLGLEPSERSADFDQYTYDPMSLPEIEVDFNDMSGAAVMADYNEEPDRADDLDYRSPPLAGPVEITGMVEVVLSVSTDAADTDFGASLYRVTPSGEMYGIAGGIQRLRYRNRGEDSPVPPGELAEVRIDCWATSVRLEKGDRLHLRINSQLFPGYNRNLNTLEPLLTATEPVIAKNRVHHSKTAFSYLLLPVVPREDAPKIEFVSDSPGTE